MSADGSIPSQKRPSLSLRKKLVFAAIPVILIYLVGEGIATGIARATWKDTTIWLDEDSGRTIQFDPILGYRLTGTTSRSLRATDGRLEYVGVHRGNCQGFPDRDDFGPKRTRAGVPRIAVFGDSFTDGQFLGQNWPDRAEDLARGAGASVEFLNLAQAGHGLANWWSILTKLIVAEEYEIDGVIFVVYASDLSRKYTVSDCREGNHPLFGRSPGWAPETFPDTLDKARPFLKVQEHVYIVGPEEFERAIQGHWPPSVPRPFRLFIMNRICRRIALNWPWRGPDTPPKPDHFGRDRLIADIRRVLAERRLPALVVHLPDRAELVDKGRSPEAMRRESQDFARAIGARFLDGGRIFEGLTRAEIWALFMPHDGHWNQAGSNRFAQFLLRNLDGLVPSESSQRLAKTNGLNSGL